MTTRRPFEIGLFTFGEITREPANGRPPDPAVRLREFVDLEVLPAIRRETGAHAKVVA